MQEHQQQGYQINESSDTAKNWQGRSCGAEQLSNSGAERTADTICLSLQVAPPEIRNQKSAGKNVI